MELRRSCSRIVSTVDELECAICARTGGPLTPADEEAVEQHALASSFGFKTFFPNPSLSRSSDVLDYGAGS